MKRSLPILPLLLSLCLGARSGAAQTIEEEESPWRGCGTLTLPLDQPSLSQFRCRYQVRGEGHFGVPHWGGPPVYRTLHPLPGVHLVGVEGLPAPRAEESFERWEWRLLRARYPATVERVERGLEHLHPFFASRLMRLEERLRSEGISFYRRETWRSPERQAYLFQQGRSRPGPIVTTTLTSWHSQVDERGVPTSKAADYTVSAGQMRRFHQVVAEVGLASYGAESSDPGHVYVPEGEAVTPAEASLLRYLPRVDGVKLATGRPLYESPTRALRDSYARASRELVQSPFPQLALPLYARRVPVAEIRHLTLPRPPQQAMTGSR